MKTETIREWYMKEYPLDECGKDINPEATFFNVLVGMAQGEDFYEKVYGDSIIRERVFAELSKRLGCKYDDIYYLWLYKEKGRRSA